MTNRKIKARDANGKAIRSIKQVRRDIEAAELRGASLSYRQIGEQLGVPLSTAEDMVSRGLAEIPTDDAKKAKLLELAKLDRRERHLLGVMTKDWLLIHDGEVIIYSGKPLLDPRPALTAERQLTAVAKRRASLMGLDAPAKVAVTHITESVLDAAIRELLEEADLTEQPELTERLEGLGMLPE